MLTATIVVDEDGSASVTERDVDRASGPTPAEFASDLPARITAADVCADCAAEMVHSIAYRGSGVDPRELLANLLATWRVCAPDATERVPVVERGEVSVGTFCHGHAAVRRAAARKMRDELDKLSEALRGVE